MNQQKPKSRLGRGLSSLISVTSDTTARPIEPSQEAVMREVDPADELGRPRGEPGESTGTPLELPVDAIAPNPHQPRQQWDETALAELAASIKANGVIQPIVVRKTDLGYQLIAGERRLRASRLAGLATIPAIVRETDLLTQAQLALVENIQRADLNPIERGLGYKTLIDELGLTTTELATRLGEERTTVHNHLRIIELPDVVQKLIREGKLTFGHAKVLAGLTDPTEQARLAQLVVMQSLSVRNLERIIQQKNQPPEAAKPKESPVSAHIKDLETSLTKQIGLRVQVRTGAKQGVGRLVIHYNSLTEFDDLVDRLGVELE